MKREAKVPLMVRLPAEVHRRAVAEATRGGVSLNAVVIRALSTFFGMAPIEPRGQQWDE